jgi:hypothetical protein
LLCFALLCLCVHTHCRSRRLLLPLITLNETYTHSVGLLWPGIGPSQRPLPDNTQHSHKTDIHEPGGIRTRIPSKREVADPRLRKRCHPDRTFIKIYQNIKLYKI